MGIHWSMTKIKGGLQMRDKMIKRCKAIGDHVISTHETVRQAAETFGVSKTTVHMDITERLRRVDPIAAKKVQEVLDQHTEERHIRGGEATKQKYERMNNQG